MIRLILTSPAGLEIDQLTDVQKQAIQSVFAQYVLPMPGTISYGDSTYSITIPDPASTEEEPLPDIIEVFTGNVILDATVSDNFNPESLIQLDLPFTILGQWFWDGYSAELNTITPLDSRFNKYLLEGVTNIPHNWAGWPEVTI